MKIETRHTSWGIELKNDKVSEDIYEQSKEELKETTINLLDVSLDLLFYLGNDEIMDDLQRLITRVENIKL